MLLPRMRYFARADKSEDTQPLLPISSETFHQIPSLSPVGYSNHPDVEVSFGDRSLAFATSAARSISCCRFAICSCRGPMLRSFYFTASVRLLAACSIRCATSRGCDTYTA